MKRSRTNRKAWAIVRNGKICRTFDVLSVYSARPTKSVLREGERLVRVKISVLGRSK